MNVTVFERFYKINERFVLIFFYLVGGKCSLCKLNPSIEVRAQAWAYSSERQRGLVYYNSFVNRLITTPGERECLF